MSDEHEPASSMTAEPTSSLELTVLIPCFNEQANISACLSSLLASEEKPESWELLVIDGMSTDDTRNLVLEISGQHPEVVLVDNPERLKPAALNLGIRLARGRVIMRIDAHAHYDPRYVRNCLNCLAESGADNVGGVRLTHVDEDAGPLATALALAVSDPAAVGDAHYRSSAKVARQVVDTVFCGCYRAEIFETIGDFNDDLVRAQDRELNARLNAAGGTILLDPEIQCTYYSRTELWPYVRWTFQGAFWLFYARRFTEVPLLKRRNVVPISFTFYLLLLPVLLMLLSGYLVLVTMLPLIAYVLVLFRSGVRAARGRDPLVMAALPFVLFLTHVTYGFGSMAGALAAAGRGKARR